MYPRVHLALDNCFASKRYTQPHEWMSIATDMGVTCLEASADNECDPLYTPKEVLADWVAQVKDASTRTGAKVVNLYSGHGTYATLGLAHHDVRIRDHIQHRWIYPMIDLASQLQAGLGFFCHAFDQATLQNAAQYTAAQDDLFRRLAEIAAYADDGGLPTISVEQMYSPHQIPWTQRSAAALLKATFAHHGKPIYLTLDTGHMVGQQNFFHPIHDPNKEPIWRGYLAADASEEALMQYAQGHEYLFAHPEDGDLYGWLRNFGAYSPIIHIQQTDGTTSAHRPFTERYNATGIVKPLEVLRALKSAYEVPAPADFPPHCADIYLTIEVFSGTAQRPQDSLADIRETIAYWRQHVPIDGQSVNELA
jgi:D-erythrulose 1-phosphate 3-epimerase